MHMTRVRKATTCANVMLLNNPTNCAAVTSDQLDQLIDCMSVGSARYSWYLDVLLTLIRGLPSSDSTLPLTILRKLMAKPDYLIVLFSGASGRERRARSLVGQGETSGVRTCEPANHVELEHHQAGAPSGWSTIRLEHHQAGAPSGCCPALHPLADAGPIPLPLVTAASETSLVAYHHALVQMLSEMATGVSRVGSEPMRLTPRTLHRMRLSRATHQSAA